MQATFTDTQNALRDAVRDLLSDQATSEAVRTAALVGDGFDAGLWAHLVAMGVTDLPGPIEQGVVAEELGRVVAPVPYVEQQVALAAVLAVAPAHVLARGMASGDVRAVLATGDVLRLDEGLVRGQLGLVPHARSATHLLAVAGDGHDEVLVAIDANAAMREPLPTMDRTRPLAQVAANGVAAEIVGQVRGLDRPPAALTAATLYAHDLVGVGQACLDGGVAYARTRQQFGRAIGSYQAVSHRLVDMFVALESARSHAYHAAWAVADGDEAAPLAASQAKAAASDAAVTCAQGAIQVHGGIGFTWEHDLHLYLKRARSGSALWGTPSYHRRRITDLIGA